MQVAAASVFNHTDQMAARNASITRLPSALKANSERINAAASPPATASDTSASASAALSNFAQFHHALTASIRVNQFIASRFLFDPIR